LKISFFYSKDRFLVFR